MKIRTKIALQFTAIIALILATFSASFYYIAQQNRKDEFFARLRDRALTDANLLIKVGPINTKLLKLIDQETLSKLYAEKVLMFNADNKVLYASYSADSLEIYYFYNPELLKRVRERKYVETTRDSLDVVGVMYTDEEKGEFVVMASAQDYMGKIQLEKLRESLVYSFLFGVLITIVLGFIFAGQSLKPISAMNKEISTITAYNLRKPLNEGNRQDEIAQLAINFNQMLERLEESFDLQRSFVSNASHELRTPLAGLKSEIQVSLEEERTPDEYRKVLRSVLNDTQRLIQLTNGLLQLAQSEKKERSISFQEVRLDELIFETQEELLSLHNDYQINIDFDDIPDLEQDITVLGNGPLLKTVFSNLIDNACKYSSEKRAEVRIGFNDKSCFVRVIDKGIGIPDDEKQRIFEPLYRAKNATAFRGYGIGLSVCRRIVDMHRGSIRLQSELHKGSTFEVVLPHV
ncbi:HAMP domain-containing protein [Runella sp. CRIBMP]|uniref:histidine kinase n=1 Tax=Runella salmonicolor TaxID=2950278 RepID=A0ABT1FJB7_9BACT|nr:MULTISPECIES: HAMP domain-containing sensor histidine kinase [Runella]MCP1381862.1 HAMP domain-containing histidine kinase [Runella salmonicolor]NBB18247.1 HAMP domain-containing protein [Runella sp. CRIBMP]